MHCVGATRVRFSLLDNGYIAFVTDLRAAGHVDVRVRFKRRAIRETDLRVRIVVWRKQRTWPCREDERIRLSHILEADGRAFAPCSLDY